MFSWIYGRFSTIQRTWTQFVSKSPSTGCWGQCNPETPGSGVWYFFCRNTLWTPELDDQIRMIHLEGCKG